MGEGEGEGGVVNGRGGMVWVGGSEGGWGAGGVNEGGMDRGERR